jgi:hypothetical protein
MMPSADLPVLKATTQPLTGQSFEFFVAAMASKNGVWQPVNNEIAKSTWSSQIFQQRLQSAGLDISCDLFVLIVLLADGVPGHLVSWTWTLANMAHRIGTNKLTMHHWIADYGTGVPDDDEYSRVWDAQKHPDAQAGNRFDQAVTWQHLLYAVNKQ